jgi:PQQ-like domain
MKQYTHFFRRIICIALVAVVAATGFGISPATAAVTDSTTPDKVNYGALKWSKNMGTGYANAPTPPLVHGDAVYVGMNQTLYKLDKETGEELASVTLTDTFGFATAALTYAENVNGRNVIFAPISEGVVQAIDADTMTSLWVTKPAWTTALRPGLSCLSRVIYDDGYIYYGTWNTDDTTGYFYCHSTSDSDPNQQTELKEPTWMVEHTGGFYWSEANVSGDFVLFGSEDGNNGYTTATKTADLYSCMKGGDFVSAGNTIEDKPVIDQYQVNGDIRSGVVYDHLTSAYYFTSRPGNMYKTELNPDGTFTAESKVQTPLTLGGVTTGTPTVYQGKIYVGTQGPTPFGTTGHMIKVIDGQTMSIEASGTTPGFVQSEMVLSTAKETDGELYLYMTYNQLPGGIYMMKLTKTAEGKMAVIAAESGNLFIPPASMQHYGISTLEADGEGNLYYKNDSCSLMAVKAGYLLESIGASGGSITKSTSVLAGEGYTFLLTPSTGYKIADLKVDGISKGALGSYTFNNVTAPHKVQGIFIYSVCPNLSSATSAGYNSIKLNWSKQAGVSGYEIWRSTSSTGTYTKIKTLTATTTTYTNTGLTTGKAYYYKISSYYKNTLGTIVYSKLSASPKGAVPKLTTPVLTTTAGTDKIKLSWKAVAGASGYRIYKKTSATSAYYRAKTIYSGSTTTWTNYGLTTGKTYYYKIVAYRVVSGKTYYSSFSNVSYRKPY